MPHKYIFLITTVSQNPSRIWAEDLFLLVLEGHVEREAVLVLEITQEIEFLVMERSNI